MLFTKWWMTKLIVIQMLNSLLCIVILKKPSDLYRLVFQAATDILQRRESRIVLFSVICCLTGLTPRAIHNGKHNFLRSLLWLMLLEKKKGCFRSMEFTYHIKAHKTEVQYSYKSKQCCRLFVLNIMWVAAGENKWWSAETFRLV